VAFHELPFSARLGVMGDIAEGAFEKYAEIHNVRFERYGFDRSKLAQFWLLADFVKATPDYVCIHKKNSFFVEAKGCGRGNHFKIKEIDLVQYLDWNDRMPLYFFAWDSSTSSYTINHIEQVAESAYNRNVTGHFSDNNKMYYEVAKSDFEWKKFEV
jgi:hypothetical protein